MKKSILSRKIKQINKISQNDFSESWHVIDEESNEKFIQVTIKSSFSTDLLLKLENASRLKYFSLIPIVSFNLFSETENEDKCLYIFYNDNEGKSISELLRTREDKNEIDSLQKFYFINGILCLLLYFQIEGVDSGSLTENDIFLINGKPKVINYCYSLNVNNNPYQSFAKLIKLMCIDDSNECITNSKQNCTELCFYKDLYNVLNNSSLISPPKIQNIIKGILNLDLQSIGLEKYSKEIEEYQSQIISSSLKSKFVFQISQKIKQYGSRINEANLSVSNISQKIKNIKKVLLSIQENKNEERIKQTAKSMNEISLEIDRTISSFQYLTDYSNIKIISNSSVQNPSDIKSIFVSLNPNSSGIFNYLINSQETVFDHTVIPSQSSGDVYCIIDSSSTQNYSSGSGDYEWIQFEFPEEIEFTSFKIQSAHRAFLKTWDIIAYDSNDKEILLFKTKNNLLV